jgi:hypothetical protein
MEINELQDNDTMEDTLTGANAQQFYGSLPENFNATITFEKKTVTDFHNTMALQTLSVMNFKEEIKICSTLADEHLHATVSTSAHF